MQNRKILLVDDEVNFINNLSKLLQNRGYDVTAVHSGENAIEALNQARYDVMVVDLKMPGMDGITVLKEIQKLQLTTQTIVLTGYGAIDTAMEAISLGAHDYLAKPCGIDELEEKLKDALMESNNKGKNGKKRSGLGSVTKGLNKK